MSTILLLIKGLALVFIPFVFTIIICNLINVKDEGTKLLSSFLVACVMICCMVYLMVNDIEYPDRVERYITVNKENTVNIYQNNLYTTFKINYKNKEIIDVFEAGINNLEIVENTNKYTKPIIEKRVKRYKNKFVAGDDILEECCSNDVYILYIPKGYKLKVNFIKES